MLDRRQKRPLGQHVPPRQVNTLTPAFSAGDHHHDHPPSVWAAETGNRAGTYRAAPSRGLTPPETGPPTGMRRWESWASQQGVRTALTTDSSKSQRHTKPCPAPSAGNPSLPAPQFPRRPAGPRPGLEWEPPSGSPAGSSSGSRRLPQDAAPRPVAGLSSPSAVPKRLLPQRRVRRGPGGVRVPAASGHGGGPGEPHSHREGVSRHLPKGG